MTEADGAGHGAPPTHYVAVGASAGGLEAIEALFQQMPSDPGAAFIVVQHLSPDYKSLMVELLSKRTRMPVARASDGMLVDRNHVYLIPPKNNLTIYQGKLYLAEPDYSQGINLPIDIFMRSLAEDQTEKAVGIILSGTGSDGMRGIRAIKERGGVVIVQSEESAKFDGMPRAAISTGLVDFVLPAEKIAEELLAYMRHPYVARQDRSQALLNDEDGLARIFSQLRAKTGVDFAHYKPSTVIRRIERRMTVNQIHDLMDYVRFIENYPREVTTLYRELLIGVTNFFRDSEAFEYLGEHVLPKLFEASTGDLRFWAPGCSSGEEAYSLAILCQETAERMRKPVDVKIFATDIDRDAVLRAGNGVYPESIAADVSPQRLTRFFHRRGESFRVARSIREMVVFAQHNLVKDPPFTRIDLVSCRNLLIYLLPKLQQRAIDLFLFALRPGGMLFLGNSETTGELSEHFETVHSRHKLFRSKGTRRHDTTPPDLQSVGTGRLIGRSALGAPISTPRHHSPDHERVLERFVEGIAEEFVSLAIIVNEGLEVVHVVGDPSDFLRVPTGKMYADITRMTPQDLSIPLATGVQKVIKEQKDLRFSNVRLHDNGAEQRIVEMRMKLLPQKKGQDPLVCIFVNQVASSRSEVVATDADETYDVDREAAQRIQDLEQDLQFSRESLQATIEELETSNEELQATNEELLAANEELQSTNEELQSVNEELYTVNAEHQAKINELTELNNDIDNLLSSADITTIFLDENLEVRKFTSDITEILNVLDQDVGRPINHITHQFADLDLGRIAEQVRADGRGMSRQVRTRSDKWYMMRVLPYHIGPSIVAGVVITFTDIDELTRAKALLEETGRMARIGGWEFDLRSRRLSWTPVVYEIHELEPGQTVTLDEGLHFYTDKGRGELREALDRAINDGEPFDLYLPFVTAKGNHRWVRSMGRPVYSDDRIVAIGGTFQDVTVSDEARRELRTIRERDALVEAVTRECPFALHITPQGELREDWHAGPIDEVFPGATEDSLQVPDGWTSLLNETDRERLRKLLASVEVGAAPVHFRCDEVGCNGRGIDAALQVVRTEPDGSRLVAGTVRCADDD
jgi:two-component system CheB/CheR fusion protein